jgi:hypothetical protein
MPLSWGVPFPPSVFEGEGFFTNPLYWLAENIILIVHSFSPKARWRPECVICKESVPLEESKVDEYGKAVHEECYVFKLTRTPNGHGVAV